MSVFGGGVRQNAGEVAQSLANDLRKRRIERAITRKMLAEKSGVALSNIIRFEQKGLVSLKNLILLAMAMDYLGEIQALFATPKYHTMEELTQIRKNSGKKKAYNKNAGRK